MKSSEKYYLPFVIFFILSSVELFAQNHFQKKISNFFPLGIHYNLNNEKVIYGRDSLTTNILIFREENGNIGWSIHLKDTSDYGNSSSIIQIKLLTRRQTLLATQVVSGFGAGGTFHFSTRYFEFDSLGNILWNMYMPIYNTCNIYENPDGSYSFFGGLDIADNSGEAIYGKIDSSGQSLYIQKSSPNSSIRGFDFSIKTSDDGYFTHGRKYNGNNFELVLMKFDSTMSPEFVRRINFGTDIYGMGSIQLGDGSFVSFINTFIDTSYVVKINSSGTSVSVLRINNNLFHGILNSAGSNILLTYTTNDFVTGVLRLDSSLGVLNNYSIADSSLHSFITYAETIDSNFIALCANSLDDYGLMIQSNSLFSEACFYNSETLSTDLINITLVGDSISFAPYGSSSPAFPVNFYFTGASPQWSDSCFTMINGISDLKANYAVELFPNPVFQQFYINLINEEKIKSMNVFSMIGQKQKFRYSLINNGTSAETNVADLSPGIYFLDIITEKNRIVKKFIKE